MILVNFHIWTFPRPPAIQVYAAPQATFFRLIGQARRYRSGPGRFHSRVSFIAQPVPNFNEQTGLFSPLINVHLFELLFQNGRPR